MATSTSTATTTTTVYRVPGMTCDHCVRAVSQEIGAIPGVTGVAVDLSTCDVTVQSSRPLDVEDVRAAVDEAGYELAG